MPRNRKRSAIALLFLTFGRDEATRTPDPYVPNVVRYQLRYIPIFGNRMQRYAVFLKYVQKRGDFFDKSAKKQSEHSDCSEYSDNFLTVFAVVATELVESIALADILLLRLIARQLIKCLIGLELRCVAMVCLNEFTALP